MENSRSLAGLIGPTLIAVGTTEAFNMDIFAAQTAPVVYLNGTLLFVAGLAIVRAHNVWSLSWRVLLTASGWVSLCGGLYRMVAPAAPQAGEGLFTYLLLAVLVGSGGLLTFMAYRPERAATEPRAPHGPEVPP
ncbi:hypothetical protein [Pyxidicoccus caerfyrddinensis]|uniref:hypothetical protein n=1 Tax=Pyxidicoccus caerfyrddinensis TaxID=2709663 RepID=UPI0013D8F964|nr:hypothetical protein [Pyxidicoccus caerfyrddinensis]